MQNELSKESIERNGCYPSSDSRSNKIQKNQSLVQNIFKANGILCEHRNYKSFLLAI